MSLLEVWEINAWEMQGFSIFEDDVKFLGFLYGLSHRVRTEPPSTAVRVRSTSTDRTETSGISAVAMCADTQLSIRVRGFTEFVFSPHHFTVAEFFFFRKANLLRFETSLIKS